MRNLLLVLAAVSVGLVGCASFTASESGHRFRGLTAHPAKVMRAAGEAEINSATGYAIRSQADDISLAVERRDVLPIPSYGYGGYGGLSGFDSEFYGLDGIGHPGYMVPGRVTPHSGGGDPEVRRIADENRQVLRRLEKVMRSEATGGQ